MWYLACCDDEGICIGFLTKDKRVLQDADGYEEELIAFKKKADCNEIVLQINMSRSLLGGCGGYDFRVVPVKC